MLEFDDLQDHLPPEFSLPVNGKTYAVSPSTTLILQLRQWYAGQDQGADGILALIAELYGADYDTDTKVITGTPGSVWAQMEADGASGEQLMRVGTTTALWFGMSHEMALRFWKQGNIAEPDPPARAPRRTPSKSTTSKKKGA